MLSRPQYPAEVIAQASLEIASDPEIGNPYLAGRVEELISAGQDPFHLVFSALGNGRVIMERAERIRLEQTQNGKNGHNGSSQKPI